MLYKLAFILILFSVIVQSTNLKKLYYVKFGGKPSASVFDKLQKHGFVNQVEVGHMVTLFCFIYVYSLLMKMAPGHLRSCVMPIECVIKIAVNKVNSQLEIEH